MAKKRRSYRWRMAHPKVAYRKGILDNAPFPPDSKIDCVSEKEHENIKQKKKEWDGKFDA